MKKKRSNIKLTIILIANFIAVDICSSDLILENISLEFYKDINVKDIIYDSKNKIIYAITEKKVYSTNNFGMCWLENKIPADITTDKMITSPEDPSTIFYKRKEDITKITDGGLTKIPIKGVIDLYPVDNNFIYGIDKKTFKCSYDGGVNWSILSIIFKDEWKDYINGLVVNPANKNEIFLATTDGIKKSINGGKAFTTVYTGPIKDVDSICIHPANNSILLSLSQKNKIYKSIDGGKIWKDLKFPVKYDYTHINEILLFPNRTDFMVASNNMGILLGTDSGWQPINTGLQFFNIRMLEIDSKTNYLYTMIDNRLFKSEKKGRKWELIFDFSRMELRSAVLGTESIYILANDLLYKCKIKNLNDEKSWETLKIPINTKWDYWYLWVDPNNDNILYLYDTYGNRFFYGKDGGINWNQKINNISKYPIGSLYFNKKYSNYLILNSRSDLYISEDIGEKFDLIKLDLRKYLASNLLVLWDDFNMSHFFLAYDNYVYETKDKGKTFIEKGKIDPGIEKTYEINIYDMKFKPDDFNIIYAATNYGLFKSEDAGKTWNRVKNNIKDNVRISKLLFDIEDFKYIYMVTEYGILLGKE